MNQSSKDSKTAVLDAPLDAFGFEIEEFSPHKITGHFYVTQKCCQPFNVLHGGVSALICDALAGMGAHMASGHQRVAGVHLTLNYLRPAELGKLVYAEATPLTVGRTVQVWSVQLWKLDSSNSKNKSLIATSKVTLLSNMPVPESAKAAVENFKMYARL